MSVGSPRMVSGTGVLRTVVFRPATSLDTLFAIR